MQDRLCRLALIGIALIGAAFVSTSLPAKTVKTLLHDFRVVQLANGLEHPWSIAFTPDNSILVGERAGRLRVYREGRLDPEPIANVPKVVNRGQGGLFDVTLHPDFSSNQLLYLAYAAGEEGGVQTRVTRYRYDAETHKLSNAKLIFDANPKPFGSRHFGGRMVFDSKGYLYITIGDRGKMGLAQDISGHSGSVIRLHDDGGLPSDNPFSTKKRARPEIYSFGHRNPQGMAVHPQTGAVWTHEHGARGGDEINIIGPGRNYGWPVITHGIDYDGSKIGIGRSAPGLEQPLYYWVPSIAPSGMAFYTGDSFFKWKNSLFIGALRGEALIRLELKSNKIVKEERLLHNTVGRVRDVRVGPDGFIYLATDDRDGLLLRLEPVK
ncbi:MAG: PQQ-dependent sugar dehydrogenase [Alphaproteobacteria bacterium]